MGGSVDVVKKCKDKTGKYYAQVVCGVANQVFGAADCTQKLLYEDKTEAAHNQGKEKTYGYGGAYFVFEFFFVFCTVKFRHYDASPKANSHNKKNHYVHHRVCNSDGGQTFFSGKATKDYGVYGVVGQLKKIPQNKGNGIVYELRIGFSDCKIFHFCLVCLLAVLKLKAVF